MYKIKIAGEWFTFQDEESGQIAALADELGGAEMMTTVLPFPTSAGFFSLNSFGGTTIQVPILGSVSGNSLIGTVMEVVTPFTGPGTAAKSVTPFVQPSSVTPDNLLVGPIVGGGNQDSATQGVPPGQVALMSMEGICLVLCDTAATTAGNPLIQSGVTAGTAKNGVAVTGQTLGTVLQSSGGGATRAQWALIKPT